MAATLSRRDFLTTSAAAATLAAVPPVHAAGSDVLRVGLIGCGSRGTGAAEQALAADDNGFRETVRRLHDGAAGEVVALQANDYRGGRWSRARKPEWTDMVYQMRNWYNFTWLSGDFNVEQHVHFLDVCAWVMKDQYPAKAVGMGGRQVLTGPEYGQIYDHFSVVYDYPDGAKLVRNCRQQPRCKNGMPA